MSDPGSLGPLLVCVNTGYDITEHDKCCFHLICFLYIRHFHNMAIHDIYEIAKHVFPKIYLNIKMSVFEAKKKGNISAGFIRKHDRRYVSCIMQHQV